MKTFLKLFVVVLGAVVLTSCGASYFHTWNQNNTRTSIELSQKNFKVIKCVSGFSSATYVFGIGGLSREATRGNAVEDMFKSANLTEAQTIVDIYVKQHISTVLGIYRKVSYSATGVVIEFTDPTDNNSSSNLE
ncbi:MAG: hypothetical protein K2I87_05595 [Bacteroidales bacterium]|nr:hypothetical protein [Bacteroidales bacterium]